MKLRKDLEFATTEIERLRGKLVLADGEIGFEMPSLADELNGS